MAGYHLAQLNVGTTRFPLDDDRMRGFVDALDDVNALAEASPGFVWRLVGDGNDATDVSHSALDGMIVNMSVWEHRDALFEFVYRSDHTPFLRRRAEWFDRADVPIMVLWWIPAGTVPTLDDAVARLQLLRTRGPSPEAFTFGDAYPEPA